MFKKSFIVILLFSYKSVFFAQQNPDYIKMNGLGLSNFYKIDENVYRSEQPDEIQLHNIMQFDIKEFLSLRRKIPNIYNQDTTIILHQVPMKAHKIKDKEVIEAMKIIKNRKGRILVHCYLGSDRIGLIIAMYRWTKEDAIQEFRNLCFGSHFIYTNIPEYIRNVDEEKIKQAVF